MIYIVAVLIVLGPLVFVHELGHYLAAKLFGVRVEVFSIGFGKRLWGFKRGDTDYRLSALPFGGYVRMSGENPMEEHSGDPGEFSSHPRWQRFVIAIAGPAMNVVFAVALLTGLYMVHFEDDLYLKEPAKIGWVEPNSIASKIGLAPGDRIVRIDGASNPDWETVEDKLVIAGSQPLSLSVQRGDLVLDKQLTLPQGNGAGESLGISPDQQFFVDWADSSGAGAAAGLKPGDEVLKVNGSPLHSLPAMIEGYQKTKEQPVIFTIKRQNQVLDLSVRPRLTGSGYRIGVAFKPPYRIERLSLPRAFAASLAENERSSYLVVEVLQGLVRHKVNIKQMSGPIGIAQQSGEALRAGLPIFFRLMAEISVNLGIFNLLPIPILDGGLILLLLIEGVMRRDIKREVKEMVYQAAFVFIILFAVIVIYNDITKTALGKLLHLS